MDSQKISKSYLKSLAGTTVQQISELQIKYNKSYWDLKMHPTCQTPLFCQFLTYHDSFEVS